MTTEPEEFSKFLKYIPFEPYLIPLVKNGKDPDVPKGGSWKDPKYKLTKEQAQERLKQGLNVGVVATGKDLVLFDHDDPEKFVFPKETLTIKTRNGKLHKYFFNSGDVKNADGKGQYAKCGEVRAEWKYVVAAGSYVPSDVGGCDGVYRVITEKPLAPLRADELPKEFQPSTAKNSSTPLLAVGMTGSFRNQYGWSLETIRTRDEKLDELLKNSDSDYPSASEADMATLSKLLYWGYMENEAINILQHFRGREKLNREDYLKMTVSKIGKTETIANFVDVKKWNPTTGYKTTVEVDKHFEPLTIGRTEIIPLLTDFCIVHPAMGVFGDTAFVGVWVPCQISEIEEKKDKKKRPYLKDLLYLITDKRQAVLANDWELKEKGMRLACKPLKLKNSWELPFVREYLAGNKACLDDLLLDILKEWHTYIDFPDEREYVLHALWDIASYFHFIFKTFPYLYVGGIKRTGKTKCLTLHSCFALNAFFSNNMSTSSIFRLIQNARGTLLIDETEKLRNPDRALDFRSILLAGYKKGAVVYRIEKSKKDQLVPESFEIYSPKILANISGIEDVMEDRTIPSIMKRGKTRQIINREIDVADSRWSEYRNKLYQFFLTYWKEVSELYKKMAKISELSELSEHSELTGTNYKKASELSEHTGAYNKEVSELTSERTGSNYTKADLDLLSARELELWNPIFTMARFFDSLISDKKKQLLSVSSLSSLHSLSSLMIGLAIDKTKQKITEDITETGEVILAQVLVQLVKEDVYYKVKDLRDAVTSQFDEEQKWVTTRWVGNALRRLGFKEKRRVGTGYEYKLTISEVEDLAERLNLLQVKPLSLSQEKTDLNVKSLVRLTTFFDGVCERCGFKGKMDFQVNLLDDTWGLLCEKCGRQLEKELEEGNV